MRFDHYSYLLISEIIQTQSRRRPAAIRDKLTQRLFEKDTLTLSNKKKNIHIGATLFLVKVDMKSISK